MGTRATAAARLGAFALALAAVFGLGYGAGSLVGPLGDDPDRPAPPAPVEQHDMVEEEAR